MNRRECIALLGGAAAATGWPLAARAQQAGSVRRVGVLVNGLTGDPVQQSLVAAFEQALRGLGWRPGQNIEFDLRWTEDNSDIARTAAAALVAAKPDVLFATNTRGLTAAQEATRTIPIVFASVSDPVAQGFVADLAHPGGNTTGFAFFEFSVGGKWVDLLKQVSPSLARVGLRFNPVGSPQYKFFLASIEAAAPSLAVEVMALPVQSAADIDMAMAKLAERPNSGLVVGTDNFLVSNREQVAALALKHRLPSIFAQPQIVDAGGLMSYGTEGTENYRGAAVYIDRILKGAKPGDLPVQFASKFRLKINLKTVQALGLELPMSVMLTADEVIE
jgi:putative tryptophan/tyrosine transport system substrate-binding protein